jgi:hypothetical protein
MLPFHLSTIEPQHQLRQPFANEVMAVLTRFRPTEAPFFAANSPNAIGRRHRGCGSG